MPLMLKKGKTKTFLRFVCFILIFECTNHKAIAQLLLEEHFNYDKGYLTNLWQRDDVSKGNWKTLWSGYPSTETLMVVEGNLNYYGYESDIISKRLIESVNYEIGSGETVYRSFSKQNSGIVFCSFLLNVIDTINMSPTNATTPYYFIFMRADTQAQAYLHNLIRIRKGSAGNTFQFVYQSAGGVTTFPLLKNFTTNTTHLVVTAYKFGTNNNDSAFLWINPNTKIKLIPDLAIKINPGDEAPYLSIVAIYYSGPIASNLFIDAIRVGKTWKDIMGKPPVYCVFQVNGTNTASTLPDSMDVDVRLRGTVVGFNQQDSGLRFLLHDGTGGITVLNVNNNFGLQLKEKDSVDVRGTITSNKGLVCIYADTVIFKAGNKPLINVTQVSTLNENSENKLVRINNLSFLTVPTEITWQNKEYKVKTPSNDTVTIRLLAQSSLINKSLPSTIYFDITGIAGQQSSSTAAPFKNDGYYIVPRYVTDVIQPDTLRKFNLLSPTSSKLFNIGGDSSTAINFIWLPSNSNVISVTSKYTIQIDTINGNFGNPRITLISELNGNNNNKLFSYGVISGLLKLKSGQTYYAKWRVKATSSSGNYTRYSDSVHTITFVRDKFNSLYELLNGDGDFRIYPNPASTDFTIEGNMQGTHQIKIYSLSGKLLQSLTQNSYQAIDISSLQAGLYFVQIQFENGVETIKLLVEK